MDEFQRVVKTTFPSFFISLEEREKIKIELESLVESLVSQNLYNEEEFGENIIYHDPYEKENILKENTENLDRMNQSNSLPGPGDHVSSAKHDSNLPELDKEWLMAKCADYAQAHDSFLDATQLCIDIFTILRTSDADIETALFDLLGYGVFEWISLLIDKRQEIVDTILSKSNYMFKKSSQKKSSLNLSNLNSRNHLSHGTQVSIMTQEERDQIKNQKKQRKKEKKAIDQENDAIESAEMLGLSGDRLKQIHEKQLQENSAKAPLKPASQETSLPNVFQSRISQSFNGKVALPAGTTREDNEMCEEITIPVSVKPNIAFDRINIDRFEKWIKPTYRGYTSLNQIQSIVFPIAFETNENMLVCAPTGAGKTDVAMLAVLRTISMFRINEKINLDDFKIIYVAPMKALAAEITRKFSSRLSCLGVKVQELTGDMQLTKAEINATQMIVTTPEKWDVVTRKSVGDTQLVQKVQLLIIDEVHLLHEDRGSVIESIVARTLRLVESQQSMIRIVGLSATLPNYVDVAEFLGVNLRQGLFFFDASFRPIPLEQHLIGVKGKAGTIIYKSKLDSVCYQKVSALLKEGHQVMVFVHSRKDTVKTGQALLEEGNNSGEGDLFSNANHEQFGIAWNEVQKSRNRELKELFRSGIGIHHAGMLRSDRTMTERMFEKGLLKVLCCTATLAWGVNLPAYAVVIKGTSVYNADKGTFMDLSILDVLQIFGRAGRPQFEDRGVGYILTSHDKLSHYVSAMTQQHPIESSFNANLVDNLNAEISLGTITNMDEAIKWLSYTYLFVRMKKNPLNYGMDWNQLSLDPSLVQRRQELLEIAANKLHKAQMIVFDARTGFLTSKDLGRIASNFYIKYNSIEIFNTMMKKSMTEADVLAMLSMSSEFENISVRQDELIELKKLDRNQTVCTVKGGADTNYGKTNILLQSYISRGYVDDFALVSDSNYVAQNSSRIMRALFGIALSRNWGPTASVILSLCKSIDRRMWSFQHPLVQFDLRDDMMTKVEKLASDMTMEALDDMDGRELGELLHNVRMGDHLRNCVRQFPKLSLTAQVSPLTRTILKICLEIIPTFQWNDRVHGSVEPFHIWVEDSENTEILYSDYLLIHKKQNGQPQLLEFTVPLPETNSTSDGLPTQLFIRSISDKWHGAESILPVSFKHLLLPEDEGRSPHTDLLPLRPISIKALQDPVLESICGSRFQYFNPVQTQVFHILYNTRENVLLGAPTGSGKTVVAELALWSAFRDFPSQKVVYIAPLKALVRERVQDWRQRLMPQMKRKLVELTGDITPDLQTIQNADIIITTPEKWDGVSRSWKSRGYVSNVSCIIIDEIHLLGGDRGPILEVIVSRMNYISSQRDQKIRIIGLSTALANASDLADWLGIGNVGLFNFRHSVRPVPLEIYIEGHPGKHYCPRMIAMNKPSYSAIMTHSPTKPVIVFVSSRRQTRLTSKDFISLCANGDNPRRFLHMPEVQMEQILATIKDPALKLSLQFGIGLHHAGIIDSDRKTVEELFYNSKIQVLIATSTLAWGVNLPAHLVVIKGTEFYDAKSKAYKDFPITDVLQMMGRAGRPQFDDSGVACVLVHDIKKNFYKKFLHQPFPVESSMHLCLEEHLNAEISSGTIKSKQDAMDWVTWTYLYRRVFKNPSFYGCEDYDEKSVNEFLSRLIEDALGRLIDGACVIDDEENHVIATPYGKIASHYYLKFTTMKTLKMRLNFQYEENYFSKLLRILCDADEFAELPVRHNEDLLNMELGMQLPIPLMQKSDTSFDDPLATYSFDSPHSKAFLLLQAHLSRLYSLPVSDYVTDTNTVLDQTIRIIQAMIDVAVFKGYLHLVRGIILLMQCVKQAVWDTDSCLFTLPHLSLKDSQDVEIQQLKSSLFPLINQNPSKADLQTWFQRHFKDLDKRMINDITGVIEMIPFCDINVEVIDPTSKIDVKVKEGRWFVESDKEYFIKITASLVNIYSNQRGNRARNDSIHAPHFHKLQTEGWFLIVGEEKRNSLHAFKRISPNSLKKTEKIYLATTISHKFIGVGERDLNIYLDCDGYRGIDVMKILRTTINPP